VPSPERDRARRHQDDFLAALVQARDIGGEALQPGAIQATLVRVDEQGRTHLDDDAFRQAQGFGSRFAVR
jgi:hypothetical protein